MDRPDIKVGQWIKFGNNLDGYVFEVFSNGDLSVGYYQNNLKAIKEDVVWKDNHWDFKHQGPNGAYLKGSDEMIVKNGPRR